MSNVNQVAVPVGNAQFHAAGVSVDVISKPAAEVVHVDLQLPHTSTPPGVSSGRPITTQPMPLNTTDAQNIDVGGFDQAAYCVFAASAVSDRRLWCQRVWC